MFVTKLRRKYERMSMTRHLPDEHEYLDHRVDVHAYTTSSMANATSATPTVLLKTLSSILKNTLVPK